MQKIKILTKTLSNCPDHISVSENYLHNVESKSEKGFFDKKISDHALVIVDLEF